MYPKYDLNWWDSIQAQHSSLQPTHYFILTLFFWKKLFNLIVIKLYKRRKYFHTVTCVPNQTSIKYLSQSKCSRLPLTFRGEFQYGRLIVVWLFAKSDNITPVLREDYSNFHKDWTIGRGWGEMCVCVCVFACYMWCGDKVIIDIHYNEVFALSPLMQLFEASYPVCTGSSGRKDQADLHQNLDGCHKVQCTRFCYI